MALGYSPLLSFMLKSDCQARLNDLEVKGLSTELNDIESALTSELVEKA